MISTLKNRASNYNTNAKYRIIAPLFETIIVFFHGYENFVDKGNQTNPTKAKKLQDFGFLLGDRKALDELHKVMKHGFSHISNFQAQKQRVVSLLHYDVSGIRRSARH